VDFLDDLNSKQIEAVKHGSGPALILAGAGSGKTRVLTYRLAYLISQGVETYQILGVTFTSKAADEMKKRTKKLVGSSCRVPFLGTFHSVAVRILRKELGNSSMNIDQSFIIFDSNDSQVLIKDIIKKRDLDSNDQFNPRKVLNFISSCKQEKIMPNQLPTNEYYLEKVKPIYAQYQKRLRDNNALDFDDILLTFVRMLEKYSNIRKKYQDNFKYILVDEYQDTNQIQYELIKLLSGKKPNLMVVGDDWQSIYKFRGADYTNILNFKNDYPKAKVYKLEQNYRSTKNIVLAAQALIKNNQQRSKKELWTKNKQGEKIGLIKASSGEKEAKKVVDLVKKKANYSQTAILYRTHAQSRLLEESLIREQIPYQIIGGLRFYERKEIKDLISYLFLAHSQVNGFHLRRVINIPRRGIGRKTQQLLESENWQLDRIDHSKVKKFQSFLEEMRQRSQELTVDRLIDWLVKKVSYRQYIDDYSQTKEQAEYRWENIEELINVASKYSSIEPLKSLASFLEEVALMDFQDNIEENQQKLTLMTLHNAKGLEYKHVFIVGLEEGLLPHKRSLAEREEMAEERRLCYVGMTRAKETLHLSWAQARYIYGQLEIQDPSPFLSEIPDSILNEIQAGGIEKSIEIEQPKTREDSSKFNLEVGDWVEHVQLGKAQIISMEDDMIEVRFEGIGKKRLSLEYAPIKKIG